MKRPGLFEQTGTLFIKEKKEDILSDVFFWWARRDLNLGYPT